MATIIPRKMSLDVAVDIGSGDSLSFAGLVCIQDQHSKSQSGDVAPPPSTKNATQIQKWDIEFEFGHATPGSIADDSSKNSLANVLVSNGQLLTEATPFQSISSPVSRHVTFKDSSPPSRTSSKRSGYNELSPDKAARKPNNDVRDKADKKRTTASQSFGQKMLHSFLAPCRNCQAAEPLPFTDVHTLQQGNTKLQ